MEILRFLNIFDRFCIFDVFFCRKKASNTSGNCILEAFRSILAEFQPVSSRGDPFRTNFDTLGVFLRKIDLTKFGVFFS